MVFFYIYFNFKTGFQPTGLEFQLDFQMGFSADDLSYSPVCPNSEAKKLCTQISQSVLH